MVKRIFIPFLLALLLTSCGSTKSMWHADSNMRKVSIGMTKKQVLSVMGEHYEPLAATKDKKSIGYRVAANEIYILNFENDILVEWHKEWLLERLTPSGDISLKDKKDNSATKFHLDAHRNAMLSGAGSESEKDHINIHMDAMERTMIGD